MPATRQQVLDAITAINDNGNNTALEMRTVLTALLEFTETVPPPMEGTVDFFHFGSGKQPVDVNGNGLLWYSFKGIKEQTVNFTFRLVVTDKSMRVFEIELDAELSKILRAIVRPREDQDIMEFVVPVTNITDDGDQNSRPRVMSIDVKNENELFLTFLGEGDPRVGDSVFTSVHFHAPEFDFKRLG